MIVGIDGYTLQCHSCGAVRLDVGFSLDMVYLWSNQHGTKIRLFCHRCGAVHDVTKFIGKEPVIERHSMNCVIFREADDEPPDENLRGSLFPGLIQ